MKKTYTVVMDGQYYIVVDDSTQDCAAGPYTTRAQAKRNMLTVCWGETPESGIEF